MHMSMRDWVASAVVLVATVIFVTRAGDIALPGLHSIRATGVAVLALGFVASAAAVVPAFEELLHGSKAYLALTSVLGVGALAGGLWALIARSAAGLALLFAATVALWLIATVHHMMLARTPQPATHP